MLFLKKIISYLIPSPKKQRGESIIEVVTATVILSTILVSTLSILSRATSTNVNIRNRVIALNIAREGLEAVRNIRDTNWLKYSGNRRNAWICLDSDSALDNCSSGINPAAIISDGSYVIDFNSTYNRYFLRKLTTLFTANQPIKSTGTKLYKTTVAPKRYTHTSTGNTASIFYRQLEISVLNPYNAGTPPGFCDGDNPSCNKARLKVVSKIQWEEDKALRTTTLETHLFDFFERNEY